ncbi:MAG TPA: hypothetical protein VFR37_21625 [Longimicrobium sp.]|nr:hypothetical protein [Longimicrobium sp.]
MFRITRGMQVQHVHFPFPLLGHRDPDQDPDGETGAGADPPSAAPPAARENAADADRPGQE